MSDNQPTLTSIGCSLAIATIVAGVVLIVAMLVVVAIV